MNRVGRLILVEGKGKAGGIRKVNRKYFVDGTEFVQVGWKGIVG